MQTVGGELECTDTALCSCVVLSCFAAAIVIVVGVVVGKPLGSTLEARQTLACSCGPLCAFEPWRLSNAGEAMVLLTSQQQSGPSLPFSCSLVGSTESPNRTENQ